MEMSKLTWYAAANNGVDDIVDVQRPFAIKHQVSFGDLCVFTIQGLEHFSS